MLHCALWVFPTGRNARAETKQTKPRSPSGPTNYRNYRGVQAAPRWGVFDMSNGEFDPIGLRLAATTKKGFEMTIHVEKTDTFGGEANYSWVKRGKLPTLNPNPSDLAVVRRAKAWAGWSGLRCRVAKFGDMIEVRPYGLCQVMFIMWVDE